MNRAHVTFLVALGLFLSLSAYSDKSIYSSAPAAARLRQPAATHRVKSVQVQQPYQVQLQPVAVVAKPQQQAQPTYEKRVPHPVFRPVQQVQAPAPQYHYPAPAKVEVQAPAPQYHYPTPAKIEVQAPQYHYPAPAKVEVQAPAPQPTYQPAYQQQAIILPAYQQVQPAKVQAAPAYESQSVSDVDTDSHKGGSDDDDDDDDDDEERKHHHHHQQQQQAPVAFTYPAFDGYKAPAQPAYQAVVFQAPRPASYVTYEAPRPAAIQVQEEEEESYPDDLSAIPGEAGKDYPQLHRLPEEIHFTCDDKLPGYYADVDYKCQVWHSCDTDGRRQSFLCPNGTIYSQEKFVCEWWFNVDCSSSSNFFGLNEGLYKVPVRVPEVEQQPQYVSYEQQQPHYTVLVPQQPQQQQVRYEPAPAPVQKVRVTSHPVPAKYVKSSEQQQQQQQHTSYY